MSVPLMAAWRANVAFGFPEDVVSADDRIAISQDMEVAVPVDVQNIYSLWQETGLSVKTFDGPMLSPWPVAFFEFSFECLGVQAGVLLKMREVTEDKLIDFRGCQYIHVADFFGRTPASSAVVHIGSGGFVNSADGKLLMPLKEGGYWVEPFRNYTEIVTEEAAEESLLGMLAVTMAAIAFANCKNVERVEDENLYPSRQARRAAERRGEPKPPRFYTLRINPNATRKQGQAANTSSGRELSLHIVRGHFATYTEERPLFGKYSGTFWVPAHVRGSQEVGIVGKDYEIAGAAA